jgi:hypothetical protein
MSDLKQFKLLKSKYNRYQRLNRYNKNLIKKQKIDCDDNNNKNNNNKDNLKDVSIPMELDFEHQENFIREDSISEIDDNESSYTSQTEEETDEEYFTKFICESDSEEETEIMQEENNDPFDSIFIYKGTKITIKEFNYSFEALMQKMSLAKTHRNLILKFIKSILPGDNKIAPSYYLLSNKLNEVQKLKNSVFKICSTCYEKIQRNNCLNPNCLTKSNKKSLTIDVAIENWEKRIELIINKNKESISEYKG